MRAAGRRPPGGLAPARGACPAGMHPPFSFPSCGKENGPCTVQKKRPLWRAPVQWPSARRGSAYRCKRRFGPAFGHAMVFCEFAAAVPWRMVRRASGCKDAFDQLLFYCLALRRSQYFRHQCSTGSSFRAFRFATRYPGGRGGCTVGRGHPPVAPASTRDGQRQRKEKQLNATTAPTPSAPSATGRKYRPRRK